MARRGISEDRQRAAAIQGGNRMISRGERPSYTVRLGEGDRWTIVGLPWIVLAATSRRGASEAARAAIAAFLEVDPERFDVEVD